MKVIVEGPISTINNAAWSAYTKYNKIKNLDSSKDYPERASVEEIPTNLIPQEDIQYMKVNGKNSKTGYIQVSFNGRKVSPDLVKDLDPDTGPLYNYITNYNNYQVTLDLPMNGKLNNKDNLKRRMNKAVKDADKAVDPNKKRDSQEQEVKNTSQKAIVRRKRRESLNWDDDTENADWGDNMFEGTEWNGEYIGDATTDSLEDAPVENDDDLLALEESVMTPVPIPYNKGTAKSFREMKTDDDDLELKIDNKKEDDDILTESVYDDIHNGISESLLYELYADMQLSYDRGGTEVTDIWLPYDSVDDLDEYYRQEYKITPKVFNKTVKYLEDLVYNARFYTDSGIPYLQLHDNYTMWSLNPKDEYTYDDEQEYWNLVDIAATDFEAETGIEVFGLGRSGRHVCVELNLDNLRNYDTLKEIAESLEEWVVNEYNNPSENTYESVNRKLKEELELNIDEIEKTVINDEEATDNKDAEYNYRIVYSSDENNGQLEETIITAKTPEDAAKKFEKDFGNANKILQISNDSFTDPKYYYRPGWDSIMESVNILGNDYSELDEVIDLSEPRVVYNNGKDTEGVSLDIDINGKTYKYMPRYGSTLAPKEVAAKVRRLSKHSPGRALAYLKHRMDLMPITEGILHEATPGKTRLLRNRIKNEVLNKFYEFMMTKSNFEDKEEVDYYLNPIIEVEARDDGRIRVELRYEAPGYDAMISVANYLTKVVEKYDTDAYFDLDDYGIMVAYITPNKSIREAWGDEYYGKSEAKKYGDLIQKKCASMKISKRKDKAEEPGGLIYEADRLGIDMWDLLDALEGMCHIGKAQEIDDSTYLVLSKEDSITESTASTDLSDDDTEVIKVINNVYEDKGEIDSDEAVTDIEDRLSKKGISVDADYLGDMIVKSKEMIKALNESATQVSNIGSYKRDSIDLIEEEGSLKKYIIFVDPGRLDSQGEDEYEVMAPSPQAIADDPYDYIPPEIVTSDLIFTGIYDEENDRYYNSDGILEEAISPNAGEKKFTLVWDEGPDGMPSIETSAKSLEDILEDPWAYTNGELYDPSNAILLAIYEDDDLVWDDGETITEGTGDKKFSFKDAYICKGCGKPLSKCTCPIKGLKENVTYTVGYNIGDNFTKTVKVQADTIGDAMKKFKAKYPDKEITSIIEESINLKEEYTEYNWGYADFLDELLEKIEDKIREKGYRSIPKIVDNGESIEITLYDESDENYDFNLYTYSRYLQDFHGDIENLRLDSLAKKLADEVIDEYIGGELL